MVSTYGFIAREDMLTVQGSHKECLDTENGAHYEGTQSTTSTGDFGRTCITWGEVFHDGEEHNYCRNRQGKWRKPGCYVKSSNGQTTMFKYCSIPLCGKKQLLLYLIKMM